MYGSAKSPVTEETGVGQGITNPYGQTKYFIEKFLEVCVGVSVFLCVCPFLFCFVGDELVLLFSPVGLPYSGVWDGSLCVMCWIVGEPLAVVGCLVPSFLDTTTTGLPAVPGREGVEGRRPPLLQPRGLAREVSAFVRVWLEEELCGGRHRPAIHHRRRIAQPSPTLSCTLHTHTYIHTYQQTTSGRIGEDPSGIPNNLMPYVSQVRTNNNHNLVPPLSVR